MARVKRTPRPRVTKARLRKRTCSYKSDRRRHFLKKVRARFSTKPRPYYEQLAVDRLEKVFGPCQERELDVQYKELCDLGLLSAVHAGKSVRLEADYANWDAGLIVEIDGLQHYEPVPHFGGAKAFHHQSFCDRVKRGWALAHNIVMVRLPNFDPQTKEVLPPEVFLSNLDVEIARADDFIAQRDMHLIE